MRRYEVKLKCHDELKRVGVVLEPPSGLSTSCLSRSTRRSNVKPK